METDISSANLISVSFLNSRLRRGGPVGRKQQALSGGGAQKKGAKTKFLLKLMATWEGVWNVRECRSSRESMPRSMKETPREFINELLSDFSVPKSHGWLSLVSAGDGHLPYLPLRKPVFGMRW